MNAVIRAATSQDAEAIGQLAAAFQAYLHTLDPRTEYDWGANQYLRDGFGDDPAFEGLVAEVDGLLIGFALYHWGYDTDRGQRYIHLIDLFVSGPHRRGGVGQALMDRIATIGRRRGAALIVWSVLKENRPALSFYERLGAAFADDQLVMWCPIAQET